jgi:hypothetical protein
MAKGRPRKEGGRQEKCDDVVGVIALRNEGRDGCRGTRTEREVGYDLCIISSSVVFVRYIEGIGLVMR